MQLLDIIVSLFIGCSSCVKRENIFCSVFLISFGVRQGSVLSPTLFSVYLDDLAKINIGIKGLCIILHADDILLNWLASKRQLLSYPYCQATWMSVARFVCPQLVHPLPLGRFS